MLSRLGPLPRLMLITDRHRVAAGEFVSRVVAAVAGGVGIVQFREPGLDDSRLRRLIAQVRGEITPEVRLVVNGRPRLARELALGLHLPAAHPALSPVQARTIEFRGRSAHDAAEAERAAVECVSYVVVGTIYPTASKPGHPGSGPSLIATIRSRVPGTPLYAIGGIDASCLAAPLAAGAYGVAVCGAILNAEDSKEAARTIAAAVARATIGQRRNEVRRTRSSDGSTQAT